MWVWHRGELFLGLRDSEIGNLVFHIMAKQCAEKSKMQIPHRLKSVRDEKKDRTYNHAKDARVNLTYPNQNEAWVGTPSE